MTDEIPVSPPVVNAEILRPPVHRAIAAWKELQQYYAEAVAIINEQDTMIAEGAAVIKELKAALEETWPEDVGGSMGGVTKAVPIG